MKKIFDSAPHVLVFAALLGPASLALSAPQHPVASFVTEGQTYQGQYAVENQSIWVNIDGLLYRGNYAANSQDGFAAPGGPQAGRWGRAFLFATSARVLQCQLDSSFPGVSGRCQSADGRNFDLKPGALVTAPRPTSVRPRSISS